MKNPRSDFFNNFFIIHRKNLVCLASQSLSELILNLLKRLCEICRHNDKFHETMPAHQRSLWIFLSQKGTLAILTILLRCLRVILVIPKPCDRFGPSDLLRLVNYRRKRVGDPLLQDAALGKKLTQPRRCHGGCKKVPRKMNLHPFKLYRVYL